MDEMKNDSDEGMTEDGRDRLAEGVQLPDKVKVPVIVPDASNHQSIHVGSPRLVHPEQSSDFNKEVLKKSNDALGLDFWDNALDDEDWNNA